MKKLIVNEHTVKLAQDQATQSFKKTYLELQRTLLHSLEWPGANKEEIKRKIEELGETYKKTIEKANTCF